MSTEANQPEKKIIVDEDWKSQVEAEKEAARREFSSRRPPPRRCPRRPEGGAVRRPAAPLPPASLSFLLGTLYLQGAIALGLLPNPVTKKAKAHPDQAKHAIDMLAMLQQKTEGNRTPEESEELDSVLHKLRLAFVAGK